MNNGIEHPKAAPRARGPARQVGAGHRRAAPLPYCNII